MAERIDVVCAYDVQEVSLFTLLNDNINTWKNTKKKKKKEIQICSKCYNQCKICPILCLVNVYTYIWARFCHDPLIHQTWSEMWHLGRVLTEISRRTNGQRLAKKSGRVITDMLRRMGGRYYNWGCDSCTEDTWEVTGEQYKLETTYVTFEIH